MAWDLTNDRPIYIQLVEHIEMQIISGEYAAGDKLPSVRDLATEASVNPNTMQKALTELEQSNLVFSVRTSGRYITEDKMIIEELKTAQAQKTIETFLNQMKRLGLSSDQILQLIQKTINEKE